MSHTHPYCMHIMLNFQNGSIKIAIIWGFFTVKPLATFYSPPPPHTPPPPASLSPALAKWKTGKGKHIKRRKKWRRIIMTQYNILQSMQCDPFHTKSNSVLIFLSDGIKTLFLLWCGRDRLLLLLFFFFFSPPFCGFFETDWLLLFLEQNWQKAFFSFFLFSRPTGWLCICLLLWVVSLFSCPSSLLSAVFFGCIFVLLFFVPWITVHVGHYLSLQASHFYGKQKSCLFFLHIWV